jgi:hypothetical protein
MDNIKIFRIAVVISYIRQAAKMVGGEGGAPAPYGAKAANVGRLRDKV